METNCLTKLRKGVALPAEERRQRARLDLHWNVRFEATALGMNFETRTENLSSNGFYCLCPQAFAPGSELNCVLTVPTQGASTSTATLRCHVRVIRAEMHGALFGIAFRIEDHTFGFDEQDLPD